MGNIPDFPWDESDAERLQPIPHICHKENRRSHYSRPRGQMIHDEIPDNEIPKFHPVDKYAPGSEQTRADKMSASLSQQLNQLDQSEQEQKCRSGIQTQPTLGKYWRPITPPVYNTPMNTRTHREKYFYTILFLDNYYNQQNSDSSSTKKTQLTGTLKTWQITNDMDTNNVKWINQNQLYVRHNLSLPITMQMWNSSGKPIVYAPILREGLNNVTLGTVFVQSARSIIIDFSNTVKPEDNQIFKLAIRSVPNMSLTANQQDPSQQSLSQLLTPVRTYTGLAIIFRRNSLDALFDLIAEFDDAYWHSMDDSSTIKYLTQKSCYKDVRYTCKYTDNMQDVLDIIDVNNYEIKYSWNDTK